MSEYVKVKKYELLRLIDAAVLAHDLLDDVHAYDTNQYRELGEALNVIEYVSID